MEKSIKELEEKYELGLNGIVKDIGDSKLVLLQFPDGLKPFATVIVDYLEEKTNVEFLIWFGSCFGACDVPTGLEDLNIDLIVQFGHNELMPSY